MIDTEALAEARRRWGDKAVIDYWEPYYMVGVIDDGHAGKVTQEGPFALKEIHRWAEAPRLGSSHLGWAAAFADADARAAAIRPEGTDS